jgi:ribosome-associated toxin RatA of RatAB toxin-antitoxin module
MFSLVDDVTAYPEFLPWCTSAEARKQSDDIVEATLGLQKGAIKKSFTTRNNRRELELEFEFESRLTDIMFGSFFEETCNKLVDAFSKRAAVVFGS